jgi:outer membrane protein
MNTVNKTVLTACLIAASISANVQAGELSAGFAINASKSAFIGEGTNTNLLPTVKYDTENFHYFLDIATYTLVGRESEKFSWRVSAVGKLRFLDRDTEDELAGMEDRDASLDVGIGFESQAPWGNLVLAVIADATSQHEGTEAIVSYSYDYSPTEKLTFSPSVEVSVYSKKLADYTYGVRASEASIALNRPEYHVDAAGLVTLSLTTSYRLSDRWTLLQLISVTELDETITNSPIVTEDIETEVNFRALYKFD